MREPGIGQGAFAELKMVMTEVLFSSGLQNRMILTTKGLAKGITVEKGNKENKAWLMENHAWRKFSGSRS